MKFFFPVKKPTDFPYCVNGTRHCMTCTTFDCYSGDKNMTPSKSYRSLITIVSNFPRISKDRESHVKMKLERGRISFENTYASYYFLELKILALFQRYSKCKENTSKPQTSLQVFTKLNFHFRCSIPK